MSIFDRELADAAVVSIGHRPGLEVFHDRVLELAPGPDGAVLRPRGVVVRSRPWLREPEARWAVRFPGATIGKRRSARGVT